MPNRAAATLDPALIEVIVQRLRAGKRIRRRLPAGGRLHIDRPLPFLAVYRRPPDRADPGTDRLVVGQGSYLVAAGKEAAQEAVGRLVEAVVETLAGQFQAVLLVELWSAGQVGDAIADGALVARPCFKVMMQEDAKGRATAASLVRALRQVRLLGRDTKVQVISGRQPAPPGLPALITTTAAERWGVLMLGIEVPPVYQDPLSGKLFPLVASHMNREISRALQQASFRFANLHTSHQPEHYLRLGRRTVLRATLAADRQLAEVGEAFSLLLAVTPVNATAALEQFRASGYRTEPTFHYRLLNWDPDLLKRRLYGISLERIEDPAVAELLRDKREELDRQIMLLHDRNSERFLYGSLQLYGGVEAELLATAQDLLARLPRPSRRSVGEGSACVDATGFARRAQAEIDRYREAYGALSARVELRDDVPGLLVSRDRLLIDQNLSVDADRVEALIHHEVGTHLLTWCNAAAQPLRLLRSGLPGYDELQEGTAVLAEYLVGGLSPGRLRLLAARVLGVHRLVQGRSFIEVFEELRQEHHFRPATAFNLAMRIFRGGGFTKDAVYLRGLSRLLAYLADGGDLEMLYVGKVSAASLPVVRELRWREVLREPPLRPRFFDLPEAAVRLQRLRQGMNVIDLLDGK